MVNKSFFFFPNVDFDSSKETSWCTERNAKNHRSLPSTVTGKIKKNLQKIRISKKMSIFGTFWWFFLIFSVTVIGKDLWFFFALRSVHQGTSLELSKSTFGTKKTDFLPGGSFWFKGGQIKLVWIYVILPRKRKYSEILRVNACQKQSAQHSSSCLV